jgi:hypothetical protein
MNRPLHYNKQHSQQTHDRAPAGFEPTIPGSKRPQTHAAQTNGTLKGDRQYARLHVTLWDSNCLSQKNRADIAQHYVRKCCYSRSKSSMMSHFITARIVPAVSKDHSAFIFWVKQLKKLRQYDDSQCWELHNQHHAEDTNLQQLRYANFISQMVWC